VTGMVWAILEVANIDELSTDLILNLAVIAA